LRYFHFHNLRQHCGFDDDNGCGYDDGDDDGGGDGDDAEMRKSDHRIKFRNLVSRFYSVFYLT
jgi:hypothetical protein